VYQASGTENISYQWTVMIKYAIDLRIQNFPATQNKANCEKTKIELE
jgi:hypothetical protein